MLKATRLELGCEKQHIPWPQGQNVFMEGSAMAGEGKRVPRHAVIKERESDEVQSPPACSAQPAELGVLGRAWH